MPIDPAFSQICDQVRSLPQNRGLRLVKGGFTVRSATKWPEIDQLGRLVAQGNAVRQIEMSIDREPLHLFLPPSDMEIVTDYVRRDVAEAADATEFGPDFRI